MGLNSLKKLNTDQITSSELYMLIRCLVTVTAVFSILPLYAGSHVQKAHRCLLLGKPLPDVRVARQL